jgi:hypothetical protein
LRVLRLLPAVPAGVVHILIVDAAALGLRHPGVFALLFLAGARRLLAWLTPGLLTLALLTLALPLTLRLPRAGALRPRVLSLPALLPALVLLVHVRISRVGPHMEDRWSMSRDRRARERPALRELLRERTDFLPLVD